MIISASRRTDIPALYPEWFMNRLVGGEVLVPNPYNRKKVSRIELSPETVDCFVFWTKNPNRMIDKLEGIKDYNYYFQFTLNPYGEDVENHLPAVKERIEIFKRLSDKIKGFQVGADDYIIKPFDIDELGARVAAHLRRENRKQGQSELRFFSEMVIDYSKREVSINGTPVNLSKKEFDIVELLSLNAGQVFDRERIYEAVWGLDGEGNSDTIMEHIRKIRSKFTALSHHSYIETVWGVGYKWNG